MAIPAMTEETHPMADFYRKSIPALCPDGKVRKVQARHYWDGRRDCLAADTFFSVPASLKYRRRYLSGYVTGTEFAPPEANGLEFRLHTDSLWPETAA